MKQSAEFDDFAIAQHLAAANKRIFGSLHCPPSTRRTRPARPDPGSTETGEVGKDWQARDNGQNDPPPKGRWSRNRLINRPRPQARPTIFESSVSYSRTGGGVEISALTAQSSTKFLQTQFPFA